ncbi:MAG: flavodoxin family protein [Planctomycetota bacterium]
MHPGAQEQGLASVLQLPIRLCRGISGGGRSMARLPAGEGSASWRGDRSIMIPKKALGIIGSPRKEKSVSTRLLSAMLAVFAEAGWETQTFDATQPGLLDCNGCNACEATGRCVLKDALQEAYDSALAAGAILVASPVYFRAPGAAVKRFVDRCQGFWLRRFRLKDPEFLARPTRPCMLIATAGGPPVPRLFDAGEIVLRSFCTTLGLDFWPGLYVTDTETLSPQRLRNLEGEAGERVREMLRSYTDGRGE